MVIPDRRRHVLLRRYGLDAKKPSMLEELETNRERLRKIRCSAEEHLGRLIFCRAGRYDAATS